MGWLEGKVALITGGGSGIGRAVVERFIEEGAQIGVLERSAQRVAQLQSDLGTAVHPLQGDATRLEDNKTAVRETVQAFGHLDILVGNVGVFDKFASLPELPEDKLEAAFDEQFAVNVKGYLFAAKTSLAELRKTRGCMVFTASVASFNSGGGGVLYTASKHAVLGMIRQLAVELAPDIRVNGVAPGGTSTDLRGLESLGQTGPSHFSDPAMVERLKAASPLQMALEPRDHTGTYVYLASRENSGPLTGSVIFTDAGAMLRTRGR